MLGKNLKFSNLNRFLDHADEESMSSQTKKGLIPPAAISREGSLTNHTMGSNQSISVLTQAWTAPPELANLNHECRTEGIKESRLSFIMQVGVLNYFINCLNL
jgi:hypothetical protein